MLKRFSIVQSDVSHGWSLSASGSSTSLVGRLSTSLLVVVLMETSFLTSPNKTGISEEKKMQLAYTDSNHGSMCLKILTHLELNLQIQSIFVYKFVADHTSEGGVPEGLSVPQATGLGLLSLCFNIFFYNANSNKHIVKGTSDETKLHGCTVIMLDCTHGSLDSNSQYLID